MKVYKWVVFFLTGWMGVSGAESLPVGAPAPDAVGQNQEGQEVSLKSFYEKGLVLVYFYPKSDTPGCTAQACSLRDSYGVLTEKGVQVVGVSFDTVASQKAFKEKYKLPFTLLADPEGAVVKAFGVPATGKFAQRQAFLIKGGKIVWSDTSASTKEQADDVLKALKTLE